jgi:hypothetical protein
MAQKKSTLAALQDKVAEHAKKAKEIQAQIREIENEQSLKVGKLVVEYHKKKWEGFDVDGFKKSVADILAS